MKKLLICNFLAVEIFFLLVSCTNKSESSEKLSNSDSLNFIHVDDSAYYYKHTMADLIDRYRYVQRGYDILDSSIKAIDTNNITEDDITWILFVSTQLHKNQTFLFYEQYKLRALYCNKIREALLKSKTKEKYPEYYEFFTKEINDLSYKESLVFDRLSLEYLFYEDSLDNELLSRKTHRLNNVFR